MFQGKNILVTGGAGFVGANLTKCLSDLGANVRATLHTKDAVVRDDRIQYIFCDLLNAEDCKRVCVDMDYVFLCAAVTSGAAVIEKTPLVHLTPNLIMNAQMLEASYASGVRKVLFISSNTVYPVTDYPVREIDASWEFYEKYFIVGWMKRFSEIMCEMYSTKIRKPMKTVVVRPANIYGPMDDFEWESSHVIPALMRKVVERHDPILVWGDGRDIKDFIYIDDLVMGLLLAMEKTEDFDPVNLASGKQYCVGDILDMMIRLDGFEGARVEFDSSKPTMIPKRLISPSKAEKKIGFKASTSIEEGIRKTLLWYRKTHNPLPS